MLIEDMQLVDKLSLSSISSGSIASTENSFAKILKDFKMAISDRQIPKNIQRLNRIVFLIITLTLTLATIEVIVKETDLSEHLNLLNLMRNATNRHYYFIDLASDMRSLINIKNNLQPNQFELF